MTRPWIVWTIALAASLAAGEARAQIGYSLQPSPASVQLSAVAGSTTPATTTVSVAGTGCHIVPEVGVTPQCVIGLVASASGGNWLSVSPLSMTQTPATLTISADATYLAAGTYSATITLACDGENQTCSNVSVPVSFTVDGLVTDQSSVQIFYNAGASSDSGPAIVNVSSADPTQTLSFAVGTSSDAPWLNVQQSSSQTPSQLTFDAYAPTLQAGSYTTAITLFCVPSTACPPVNITVTLVVNGVILGVTPNSLSFTLAPGQTQTKSVTLAGATTVAITGGPSFLTFSSSSFSSSSQACPVTSATPMPGSSTYFSLGSPDCLYVTANSAGTAAGTEQLAILYLNCIAAPCVGSTMSVSMSVLSTLNPAPATVSLTGYSGGAVVSTPVNVTASGAAVAFGATAATTNGGNWLTVCLTSTCSPSATSVSASTAAALTIQANPANLTPGVSYTGTITLACNSPQPACTGATIPVALTVNPGISVSQSPLTPNASHSHQSVPTALTVTSLESGSIPFTVAYSVNTPTGGSWLSGPASGTAATSPGTQISVISNSGLLPPGNYQGTVTITGGGTAIPVPVNFQLQGNQLSATPSIRMFSVTAGHVSAPQSVTVGLSGEAAGTSDGFTAMSVPLNPWVVVSPTGTLSLATSISVSVDATTLSTGVHNSTVAIQCISDTCFDGTLAVQATVTAPPTLTLTPSVLSAFSPVQGTVSTSQTVRVTSSDGSSLPFTVTGPTWVTLGAAGGTASGTASPVSIAVDAHSLPLGQTSGTVTFACNPVSACPSIPLSITANVTSAASLTANPPSVTFTAYQGRSASSKTIAVTASDGSALAFTVGGVPSWLTVSPASGVAGQPSGTLTLTLNPNPPAASASGSFTLTPTGSSAPPVTVPVTLTVSPFSIGASPLPLPISVVSGQTQTANLAITTIDGAPAQVNVTAGGSPIAPTVNSASVTAPGNISVTANATGVPAGSYNATVSLTCGAANPCASVQVVPVQITVTGSPQAPIITPNGIVPIYSSATTIQPGSWISIYGSNFASSVSVWTGNFPTNLDGVTVTIDNRPAYIYFVGPTQIDVQTPDDTATGNNVPVVITTSTGTTNSTVTLGNFGPSLCVVGTTTLYVAGTVQRLDGSGTQGNGAYDFIGPNGTSLGYATRPIKAGDIVTLYGVGFGPVSPAVPAGAVVPAGLHTATSDIEFLIGGINVKPGFAGITEAGLFQFNLTIPAGVGSGDVPIVATVGGLQTPAGFFIAAQ